MSRRRWLYLLGTLALSVAITALLAQVSPTRILREPAAQPAPTEASTLPRAAVEQGMQPLAHRMEDGIKTFDITLQRVQWDTGGGEWKDAYTINGMVPGPEIRVSEGERIRIHLKNELDQPASMHWHGIILPPEQDGVAHLTQDPIEIGETFTYEFTPGPPGTHMYHSHFNGAEQVAQGLYGPLIIEPKDPAHPTHRSQFDAEFTWMIGDVGLGLTMNGKGFPHTLPMKVKKGQRVLMRLMNIGVTAHPMHLHGHDYRVVAKDSNAIAQPMVWNTVNIAPGEIYDLKFTADNPGSWLFHCHILPHAEGPDGMFGLTALLEYEGYEADGTPHQHGNRTPKRLPGTPGKHKY